ncbi:IS200/IS605 family accessory protein TnpB-related protein [Streptomyces sp. NBC_00147]|uniref:IS200/IS605 family accessory protein TnpB-related protein n=1 Tax=Streptomyces sp. NBC_00147 TaxID=2975667 RepID=UPI003870BC5B
MSGSLDGVGGVAGKALRVLAAPFVAPSPSGVAVRTRLKGLSAPDAEVLGVVGRHLGSLAGRDLKVRSRAGLGHDAGQWAVRKRDLTALSSARWAGSVTKASHDQWALARRCLAAHVRELEAGITCIRQRLAQELGAKGERNVPGGYRSRREWHAKSRRLRVLEDRMALARADWVAGRVRVVRGGKRLANTGHHLDAAGLSEQGWRSRWEAARIFLSADGESGKRLGNETIRLDLDGQLSLKLPAPLADLANAPHGRYVLAARAVFAHRGQEWADRVADHRAVAYRIHHDVLRDRWYVTASWQRTPAPALTLEAALADGTVIGVDTNNDHYAAWRLDVHGNPVGRPARFFYDLSGNALHRDAQIRHATSRLLHYAQQRGASAIAIEDLDFADSKTREKHGRNKRFRCLISRFPTARLAARLISMAAEQGISVIAVDAAYSSRWGAEHWQKPTSIPTHQTTRHEAASLVIGRRAQGFGARRRTTPPPRDRRDRVGHRITQAAPRNPGREGDRPPRTGPPPAVVTPPGKRKRRPSPPNTVRDGRSEREWIYDSLPLTI